MSDDDVLRRFVINRVMCQLRLDLDEVQAKFGAPARAAIEAASQAGLDELVADGLVTFDGRLLQVHAARPAAGPQRGHALRRLPARRPDGAKQFSRTV